MTNPDHPCDHDSLHYEIEFEQTCEEAIRRLTCQACGAESVWRGDPETYFEIWGMMEACFRDLGSVVWEEVRPLLDWVVAVIGGTTN